MVAQATGFINNEQQNAAQVNNKEIKKIKIEENNNQNSMAPQAGANETEIGNAKDTATEIINEQAGTVQVINNKENTDINIMNKNSITHQICANETTNGNAKDTAMENKESTAKESHIDNQKGSVKIEKVCKDYTPKYDETTKEKLKLQTQVCEQAIARIIDDESIGAIPFNDDKNCIIDVRKISDRLFIPTVNRVHGADEKKTGESVMGQGAQLPFIVITGDMAKVAGIPYERLSKDPDKDTKVSVENSFIVIDGNGRVSFLMSISKEKWPAAFAMFPSRDACGYYNINKIYDDINTNISPWKTQDMVQKRILADQENVHPGWIMINKLVKQGYKYQAACQLCTLDEDRLKKVTVVSGTDEDIFKNYEYAKEVLEAELKVFGNDSDVLKTKMFTKEVSHLWKKIEAANDGKFATSIFISFINGLHDDKIKAIKAAKSEKGGASKDERRRTILNEEFFKFIGAEGIKTA